jgi:6-phosphogluconate dehydrogenase
MQIGLVGLGKMGGNMVHRIRRDSDADGNDLTTLEGYVNDSGEGRWTLESGIDHDVAMPALTAALFARFTSRGNGDYTARLLAALRNQFGGHAVKAVPK